MAAEQTRIITVCSVCCREQLYGGSESMSRPNPLLWPRPPVFVRYGIALLLVLTALILTQRPALHLEESPLALFVFVVLISAWVGGAATGLLATALSTLVFDYYLLSPAHSLAVKAEVVPRLREILRQPADQSRGV